MTDGVTIKGSPTAAPKISVVLVHWERAGIEDTVECLKSLAETTYPNLSAILVNNGAITFPSDRFLAALPGPEDPVHPDEPRVHRRQQHRHPRGTLGRRRVHHAAQQRHHRQPGPRREAAGGVRPAGCRHRRADRDLLQPPESSLVRRRHLQPLPRLHLPHVDGRRSDRAAPEPADRLRDGLRAAGSPRGLRAGRAALGRSLHLL